ncbi:GntR family transcriptional regulator [Rhodococcus koreensis]
MSTLRERILSGEMPGGMPLREAELCSQFGVSRHSLRTAMRSLLASGLLTHEANHGVFVSSLAEADVCDIYALRRLLELDALDELPHHPERHDAVQAALRQLEETVPGAPWSVVRDRDLQFHLSLVESMGRPRTTRVFAGLIDELALALRQLRGELTESEEVARQHRVIFEAAVSGSSAEARRLMDEHLMNARNDICAAFAATTSA